ncbi:ras-related protein RabG2, partial [Aplysia californica]|uniref:Ras-related protein RabG2 n=1 Tax=Aplysia californica TaxID=6500 RepID=A0ABM0K4N3_APLCA
AFRLRLLHHGLWVLSCLVGEPLCFSRLSDLDSFTMASGCSRVLLGNHCASPERTVTSQAARKYADSRGLPYMECDSAQFYNVIEGIQLVVDRIAKEVTINPSSSSVIKPSLKSQEEMDRQKKAFVCLC